MLEVALNIITLTVTPYEFPVLKSSPQHHLLKTTSNHFTVLSLTSPSQKQIFPRGRSGRDRMVVGFTTTCAISAYHHWCLWVRISIRVRCTTLCDIVCQWLATGQWFSLVPPVSSTNKIDHHDITEILLKVVLNYIKQTKVTQEDH